MMTRKRDHITPVLANLHWLPVTAHSVQNSSTDIQDTHESQLISQVTVTTYSSSTARHNSGPLVTTHNLLEIPRMRTSFA